MFKQDPDDLKPCPHMETWVSAWLDGALTGLMRWYTEWHVAHCPRCTDAVPVLRALRARLRRLSETPGGEALTPERRAAVVSGWERADQASGGAAPSES
ncbi:MAG: zf-HC2 domain-containing protein [Armatimonadetes bacterium]|nr:zf-HC2 domain-containing protein [Armatimonadota bacterium]